MLLPRRRTIGLDAVELILAVEEKFEIDTTDEETEACDTVGKLYALIWKKLNLLQSSPCLSTAAFYQLRRALMELQHVPRRSVFPSAPMKRLLPARERRAQWEALGRVVGAQLPSLRLPRWAEPISGGLGCALLLSALAAYWICPLPTAALYSLGSLTLAWATRRLVLPFAIQFPAACATVGGTVKAILSAKYGIPEEPSRTWTESEVWEALREVIVEQLAVSPEAVTPDAHLVNDLGAD